MLRWSDNLKRRSHGFGIDTEPINLLAHAYRLTADTDPEGARDYLRFGLQRIRAQVRSIFDADVDFFMGFDAAYSESQFQRGIDPDDFPLLAARTKFNDDGHPQAWAEWLAGDGTREGLYSRFPTVFAGDSIAWSFLLVRLPGFIHAVQDAGLTMEINILDLAAGNIFQAGILVMAY